MLKLKAQVIQLKKNKEDEKLKKQKFLVLALAMVMSMALAACSNGGNSEATVTATPTPAPTVAPVDPEVVVVTEAPKAVVAVSNQEASLNFDDGNCGFVSLYTGHAKADESTVEVIDYNGGKALAVTKAKPAYYAFIAVDALSALGDKAASVKTVQIDVESKHADKFRAMSGDVGFWTDGAFDDQNLTDWNVFLETSNPKTITVSLGDKQFGDSTPAFIIRVKDDGAIEQSKLIADLGTCIIDNIRFLDASGNVVAADSSVEFAEYDGLSNVAEDRSNLFALTDVVEFEGFSTSEKAWAQAGFVIPQEVWDALVPGSALEVNFASETNVIWFVFPNATAGWSRVGNGKNNDGAGMYINASGNTAQLRYEDIVAVCGEDKSTWGLDTGVVLQCESSGPWEAYAVRVGKVLDLGAFEQTVEFEGFACSEKAWAQSGFEIPAEVLDALVPGTALEISFESESGILWAVFPDADAGWTRVGRCDADKSSTDPAVCYNGKCYITYEQMVRALGEDKNTWGKPDSFRLQCESSAPWEVFAVNVGNYTNPPKMRGAKEFEGFAVTGKAYGQDGGAVTDDIKKMLVPGALIKVAFQSDTGNLWLVFPDAAAGWSRVGRCDGDKSCTDPAVIADGCCYVTYEQIAAVCGDDIETWGTADSYRIQFESSGAWEVYSMTIGQQ